MILQPNSIEEDAELGLQGLGDTARLDKNHHELVVRLVKKHSVRCRAWSAARIAGSVQLGRSVQPVGPAAPSRTVYRADSCRLLAARTSTCGGAQPKVSNFSRRD